MFRRRFDVNQLARYQQVGLTAGYGFNRVCEWFVVEITAVGKSPLGKLDRGDADRVQIIFVEALPILAVRPAILVVRIREITVQDRVGVTQTHWLKRSWKCRSAAGGIGKERVEFLLKVVSIFSFGARVFI